MEKLNAWASGGLFIFQGSEHLFDLAKKFAQKGYNH